MLEIGITLFILMFFLFPVPGLAVSLGAWTCYLVHRKLLLLKRQPPQWKKIIWIYFLTGALDTVLSFAIAFILACTIYFLIFDSLRLFIFNFIFCFLISFRWFDFTHALFRRLVFNLKPHSLPPPKNSVFCMLIGQSTGSGMGLGMKPVSLDSGYVYWDGVQLLFDGVIGRRGFTRETVLSVEKISSEKIKIVPTRQNLNEEAEAWIIVIRQQFYPFKMRELRDQWFERLSGLQQSGAPEWPLDGLKSSRISSA